MNLLTRNKFSTYLEKHHIVYYLIKQWLKTVFRTQFHFIQWKNQQRAACFPVDIELSAVHGTFLAFSGKLFFNYHGMSFIGSSIFLQSMKI